MILCIDNFDINFAFKRNSFAHPSKITMISTPVTIKP